MKIYQNIIDEVRSRHDDNWIEDNKREFTEEIHRYFNRKFGNKSYAVNVFELQAEIDKFFANF